MPPDPFFAHLGVDAVDADGRVHRLIIGAEAEGKADGYEVIGSAELSNGLIFASIPGLAGQWRVSKRSSFSADGFYYGSISRQQ